MYKLSFLTLIGIKEEKKRKKRKEKEL